MDAATLEKIIYEEVMRALAERQRSESVILPADQNETLDPNACKGGTCSVPTDMPEAAKMTLTSSKPAAVSVMESAPVPPEIDTGPAVLLILSGAREEWPRLEEAFRKWTQEGIRLDAVFSSSAHEVLSSDEVQKLGIRPLDRPADIRAIMYDMSRYAAVFLPSISRTHAAKLALGITDNVTLNLTLSALAQKVPTFATNEGLGPTSCIVCGNNVPGIQEVLDKYRDQLAKMGLRLCSTPDAVKDLYALVLNKVDSSGPDLITRLITEEDAAQIKGPVVKVARGGLVTPLAMESFNKRGIEVVIVPQR